jgi:hypothetical protein
VGGRPARHVEEGGDPNPTRRLSSRAVNDRRSPAVVDDADNEACAEQLAAERDLIDTTRAALARGRAGDALASVHKHATRFPNGSLAEEREDLAVQALVLSGQGDAATARAIRFHRRYPNSILGQSVDAALRTNAPLNR